MPDPFQPELTNPDHARLLELAADYERSGQGWFWSTGPNGRLNYVSESVSRVLGVAVDELVGQPIHSLLTIQSGEAGGGESPLAQIMAARQSFADLPARPAKAELELGWSITGRPQFDRAGHFHGYYGNAVAITAMRPGLDSQVRRSQGTPGMIQAERRRQIEQDLRDAVANGQIRVVYQPIVDAADNRVVALEALARWEHPQFGDIPPDVFIPIAEEASLIGQLGDWILQQACRDAIS